MNSHPLAFGPFVCDAPSHWTRQVTLTLREPGGRGRLTVAREQRAPGEALSSFARRRLFAIAQETPDVAVENAQPATIAGRAGFRATILSEGEDGPVREHVAWVDGGEDAALIVVGTTGDAEDDTSFEHLLATLHFSDATSLPRAVSSTPPPPDVSASGYTAVPMPGARSR